MSIAVAFQKWILWVYTAVAWTEHFPCRADVGSVKENDGVETGDGGMHGGYAGVGY